MRHARWVCLLLLGAVLGACGAQQEPVESPEPRTPTRESVGYYCHMILADHLGPKGQVILEAGEDTLWFSSARDTLAFLMLPEEPKRMDAVYVSDMGAAPWDHPEKSRDAWVDARDAWYVIGSSKSGGMGQAEAVPFSDEEAARRFSLEYGGDVLRYAEIAPEHILGSQ